MSKLKNVAAATETAKNEKVMASTTSKASEEINLDNITPKEFWEKWGILVQPLFSYKGEWFDGDFSLYYDSDENFYFICCAKHAGFVIWYCPSNPEDIDLDLVEAAVDCHFNLYNTYECMYLSYNCLEEQIKEAYESVQ